jgi:hypothetical protein
MGNILWFALEHTTWFLLSMLVLWIFFVNVMTWKHHEEKIPKYLKPILWVIAFIGYIYDIVFNIIYGSIMFLEPPHWERLTLSARLSHILIVENDDSWRWKTAYWICTTLIEPWDQGHCGLSEK